MSVYEKMTALADAIRSKTGGTEKLTIDQMATEVNGLQVGGDGEEWFNDGDTHIWITLGEGRTSPMLACYPNGTVTVDWGDGTAPDTLTGTSTTTVKWTQKHNYASAGEYIIRLSVDGEVGFGGTSSSNEGSYILRNSSSSSTTNYFYRNAVKKIEIGNSVTSIGGYAFNYCYSLSSITIPNSVTSIGKSAFQNCFSLSSITIPNSVTSIGGSTFNYCYSLSSSTIPNSVTSIGATEFQNCYGVRFYDFSNHTTVPTLSNANAFNNIPADCEIRVPAALYDEWKAATNWTTHASKIVAV